MTAPIIALTTDFGWGSSYVAQLKGVILSALADAHVLDVSHDLPAHDVRACEVLLRSTAFALPLGAVHIVVVDPGVGGARRPLAVRARGTFFVGPDNGVLARPAAEPSAVCVHLDRRALFREPVSPTFHGRDIFAPVACELAAGLDLADVGSPIRDWVPSRLPAYRVDHSTVTGEAVAADRFGNLLTTLPGDAVRHDNPLIIGNRPLRWVHTYEEAGPNELVALVGSDGFVEIAVKQASAAQMLGTWDGMSVRGAAVRQGAAHGSDSTR